MDTLLGYGESKKNFRILKLPRQWKTELGKLGIRKLDSIP